MGLKHHLAKIILFLFCIFSVSPSSAESLLPSGFLFRSEFVNGKQYRFMAYLPYGYERKGELPLILFLHGAGERGEDSMSPTEVGIGSAIRKGELIQDAIVLFPQCPQPEWWSQPVCEKIAIQALQSAREDFNIDDNRIYLTGLSMGGYGVWHMVSKYPNVFAAIVPIAARTYPGAGIRPSRGSLASVFKDEERYKQTAKYSYHVPSWIFHGALDDVVPVTESQKVYAHLKEMGADVKYTEFPDVAHSSWHKAYFYPNLYAWLFKQNKKYNTKIPLEPGKKPETAKNTSP